MNWRTFTPGCITSSNIAIVSVVILSVVEVRKNISLSHVGKTSDKVTVDRGPLVELHRKARSLYIEACCETLPSTHKTDANLLKYTTLEQN